MRRHQLLICLVAAGIVAGGSILLQLFPARASGPGMTERVSVDSAGVQGNGRSGFDGLSISADGRYVAFESTAGNLVPGDTNAVDDIFVRDRLTGATARVSVSSAGAQGNDSSGDPSISADGRYVAFTSPANNLVPGDTNMCGYPPAFGCDDVFLHDRVTGATERVSVDGGGVEGESWSGSPSISADGRYVAFISNSITLVPGDTNNSRDVFVHDRVTDATERVSVDSAGVQGNGGSGEPSISADGRHVAFLSNATNLVPGDTNAEFDVFVRDRWANATERVSVDSAGAQANRFSVDLSISASGNHVTFSSYADNLVPGDTNVAADVFVHDRVTLVTERVSVDSAGTQGNLVSYPSSISADGRYVAFDSFASNLVVGDTNGIFDVFVRDRMANTTERVSVNSAGVQGNGESIGSSISADGRYVAFGSSAANLATGDTNAVDDVFVRDRCPDGSCAAAPTSTPPATATIPPATPTIPPTATHTPNPVGDADDDGVIDAADNCATVPNADQANTDGNFIDLHVYGKLFDDTTVVNSDNEGDACDFDIDNDGIPNNVEAVVGVVSPPGYCPSATGPTNPLLNDTDDDLVLDGAECDMGTDPVNASSKPPAAPTGDTDHDGLTDAFEAAIGTNPALVDTDGDRLLDSVEYKGYSSNAVFLDTDFDGCSDGREAASVNADVKVNSLDMVAVASHFGPRTSGRYIKDFDVNKDGNINSIDMLIQAKLFTSLPC